MNLILLVSLLFGPFTFLILSNYARMFPPPSPSEMSYSVQERSYVEQIEKAHTYASQELLLLMTRDHDLLGHLRSMKHCFLLDQGDLLVHFMDMAETELAKPMADILPQRLESLLEVYCMGRGGRLLATPTI